MITITLTNGEVHRFYDVRHEVAYRSNQPVLSVYSNINDACILDCFEWLDATETYRGEDGNWITKEIVMAAEVITPPF